MELHNQTFLHPAWCLVITPPYGLRKNQLNYLLRSVFFNLFRATAHFFQWKSPAAPHQLKMWGKAFELEILNSNQIKTKTERISQSFIFLIWKLTSLCDMEQYYMIIYSVRYIFFWKTSPSLSFAKYATLLSRYPQFHWQTSPSMLPAAAAAMCRHNITNLLRNKSEVVRSHWPWAVSLINERPSEVALTYVQATLIPALLQRCAQLHTSFREVG